uniref:CD109 molecule n=1 Tax=Mola mola TaxID=94237 RepID=A0A3Q3XBM7_MOLML
MLTPGSIRPGVPTSLSVTVLSSSPVTVSADIVHGNQTVASTSATVAGELNVVPPQINESESSYWRPYSLEVRGRMGSAVVFSNKTQLRFNPKSLSTFIQTDKMTYRAQQAVKIRAVSVRPDGAPYVSPVDIVIRDPKGNLLRQWLNVDSVLGVASKQFQLSDNPPLGKWTVVTTVSVSVLHLTGHFASLSPNNFCVFTLRYTYGKPVYGHMNVAFLYNFHGVEDAFLKPGACCLCVQVKSRGQLVSAGKSSAALSLVPESTWAPLARVIVYCVHPSGEVVNDAIQLHVNVSWSSEVSKPGDEVTLRVDVAEPASLVGILVVDKATQWAGSKNDITKNTVRITSLPCLWSLLCLIAGKPDMEPREEPREHFPETWIWMDVTSELALTVPDSITTWAATAFVMSDHLGLGIVKEPAQLTVFQDFFLSLNLPACVIRGEELLLEIILFNYLPQDLEVTLTVARSDTFEFVFPDLEELPLPTVRHVLVRSRLGASVRVPIRPLVLGQIPISVKAMTSAASDFVRTTVLVKAEGLEQSFSSSLLFEVSALQSSLSRDVTFTFPADVVKGSERVSVSAVGDILGPSISGLDHLIQMPHGCGEQNMINFAPNIYVLQYLSATGQATQDTTDRATAYMTTGYERQLSYQRVDGSFSAFGDQDAVGSTWLSAFVLRCFLQARPFVSIDANVLHRAAAWLGAQQGADGRFEERGRVIHTELQGGLDGPVSLTAYALIALLEDTDVRVRLNTSLFSGLYNYSLSLLTYALSLAGSSSAGVALGELMGRAEMKDGVPMWSSPDGSLARSWQPRSADIEMASYLLLAHHELDLIADGLSLMKWLSRQRNHGGGFGSTQVNRLPGSLNVPCYSDKRMRGHGCLPCRVAPHSLNEDLGLNATGMAIMEVGLLSGFSLRPGAVQPREVIKKVETPPGKVVLYLDSVSFQQMGCCVFEPRLNQVMRRRTARMYNSEWRSDLSSSSFCGEDHSECTGTIYDSNAAAPCGLSALLAGLAPALLLFLIV